MKRIARYLMFTFLLYVVNMLFYHGDRNASAIIVGNVAAMSLGNVIGSENVERRISVFVDWLFLLEAFGIMVIIDILNLSSLSFQFLFTYLVVPFAVGLTLARMFRKPKATDDDRKDDSA